MENLKHMPDEQLAYVVKQLEHKVRAIRLSTSAIGVALLQEFQQRLDLARAEVFRRRV